MAKKKHQIKRQLIVCAAASVACISSTTAFASNYNHERAKLVVGVYVEGLTNDKISNYAHLLRPHGLKKLISQGVILEEVDYGKINGKDAGIAMLVTGAYPRVNGVSSSKIYDRETRKTVDIVHDPLYIGNFTDDTFSPAALKVSTITDELKADNKYNRVYSISNDASSAIITGGHAANSATWINNNDGKWSTSTYYKDVPYELTQSNYRTPLSSRLDTITWKSNVFEHFNYSFPRKDRERYVKFKLTPKANDEITNLACSYISSLSKTRSNNGTDMLNLTYSVADYPYGNFSSAESESISAILNLDLQIERLLSVIESGVGLNNAVIYIAGVPGPQRSRVPDSSLKIPTGDFSPRKAKALLNMYLMAIHGNGEWVSGYHDSQFYLNNALATEKNIDLKDFHAQAAEFLMKMSGIVDAIPIEQILSGGDGTEALRNYIDPKRAGDIMISVNPGWRIIETDEPGEEINYKQVVTQNAEIAPFIIMAPDLKGARIATRVDARAIAPTLSGILRIRAPNAASYGAISLK